MWQRDSPALIRMRHINASRNLHPDGDKTRIQTTALSAIIRHQCFARSHSYADFTPTSLKTLYKPWLIDSRADGGTEARWEKNTSVHNSFPFSHHLELALTGMVSGNDSKPLFSGPHGEDRGTLLHKNQGFETIHIYHSRLVSVQEENEEGRCTWNHGNWEN